MTAAVILVDQLVKRAVLSNMTVGETIPLLENIFHITYVQNRGAAFSMWEQQWVVLIVIPAVALAAGLVLIYIKRETWSRLTLLSVALICGGGIGNLMDRIMQGYVVDMFDCRFFPFFGFSGLQCSGYIHLRRVWSSAFSMLSFSKGRGR